MRHYCHACLLAAFACQVSAQEVCELEARLVDTFGVQVSDGRYTIQGIGGTFEAGKRQVLPCGEGVFSFWAVGFRTERVMLTVRPELNIHTIGLRPAPIGGADDVSSVIPLEIREFSRFSKSCDRVMIIPMFRPHAVIETLVSYRGRAGVRPLDPGVYGFLLVHRGGICGSAISAIDGKTPITLHLDAAPK